MEIFSFSTPAFCTRERFGLLPIGRVAYKCLRGNLLLPGSTKRKRLYSNTGGGLYATVLPTTLLPKAFLSQVVSVHGTSQGPWVEHGCFPESRRVCRFQQVILTPPKCLRLMKCFCEVLWFTQNFIEGGFVLSNTFWVNPQSNLK